MVDVGALVKIVIILAILGTATSAGASILVSGLLRATVTGWVFLAIALVLAVLSILFALWGNEDQLHKNVLWFAAIFSVIGGVAAPLVPFRFHDDDAYLNRVVVYFILLFAIIGGISTLWRLVTTLLLRDVLDGAGIDKGQESLLYLFWAAIESFILAFFIAYRRSYQKTGEWKYALHYTVGFYFVGGVLAAVIGILIVVRGQGGGVSVAGSEKASTQYDNVG